jgi:hypothetical protein
MSGAAAALGWVSGALMRRFIGSVLSVLLIGTVLSPAATGQTSAEPSLAVPPSASPSVSALPTWPDAAAPGDGGSTPGLLAWQPVGPPFLVQGREIDRLVAWDGGFAAVEFRDDEARSRSVTAAVWHSADGRAWTRSQLPAGIRASGFVALLPFKRGLVLATDVTPDIRGWGFDLAIWRSLDGRTWREVGRVGYRVPLELQRRNCQANHRDLASIDGALMLYVGLCWDPCCGFVPAPIAQEWAMAGAGALAQTSPIRTGTIAWRSPDARTWTRTALRGFHPTPRSDHGTDFFAWPEELLVLRRTRWDEPITLLRSADGVRWTPFGSVPSAFDPESGQAVVVPTATGVLLAGSSFESEFEGDPSAHGNNLLTWVAAESGTTGPTIQRQPASVTGVVRDGDHVLLIGEATGPGASVETEQDDEAWAWIMSSRDGGLTWDPAASWTGSAGSCLREAAQRGTTVVSLGCRAWNTDPTTEPGRRPQFWVADLPADGP